MEKAIIIGSGMAGLTAGAYLADAGYEVVICEQFPDMGGVTATLKQDQFGWDLGPLLLEGFLPGEPANCILNDLGVAHKVPVVREDRGISFPDFTIWKPEAYEGEYWRREFLKGLFPRDREGLDRYYQFYDQVVDLMGMNNLLDVSSGIKALLLKARMWLAFQKVRDKEKWSAEQLMNHFFQSRELKALFTAILADFVVMPSRFPALGVPACNVETAFDVRIPLEKKGGKAPLPGYAYILGGCGQMVQAVADRIREKGGKIHTNAAVRKIRVEKGTVKGVTLEDGHFEPSNLVIATGGAGETFSGLVGEDHLPGGFVKNVNGLVPMQSVLMVHLGINFDPGRFQRAALCYYYGMYDIEKGVADCRRGDFHEGRDGFLIYVPSMHSRDLAPPGHHAVTIYTIAPNHLEKGTWEERREELADKLVAEAEKIIPGLGQGTRVRVILTPGEFRKRTLQTHHSFGGLAPVMGQEPPPHRTPVKGLWFIGSQSESGGGVKGVMVGARNAVKQIRGSR